MRTPGAGAKHPRTANRQHLATERQAKVGGQPTDRADPELPVGLHPGDDPEVITLEGVRPRAWAARHTSTGADCTD